MSDRAKAFLAIAALALAMPVAAQAAEPTTTAFDGHYAGVSPHISKCLGHGPRCPREQVRDPLTITNGCHPLFECGSMPSPRGTISGRHNGAACTVDYVWHKQSG
jgi:hypothetical protein